MQSNSGADPHSQQTINYSPDWEQSVVLFISNRQRCSGTPNPVLLKKKKARLDFIKTIALVLLTFLLSTNLCNMRQTVC